MINVIENLRTVRKFSHKEVSDEDLKKILNLCVNAASASCRQTYSIIVVRDKEVMKKVGYTASAMLVFCVDYNRVIDCAEFLGYDYEMNETPIVDFITGSTDTILAAQTAAIAAKSMGIDSFFSNCIHRGDISRIYKLLNLPEKNCFPLIAMYVGYPEESQTKQFKKGRLRGPEIIHYDTYKPLDKTKFENVMKQYDDTNKHFLSLISDWKEKGFDHYLCYFYESWCNCYKKGENVKREEKNQYTMVEEMLIKCVFLNIKLIDKQ